MQGELAAHEIIDLREILTTEVVSAKKLKASMAMVQDSELKSFMQTSLDAKMRAIEEMQQAVGNMGMNMQNM